MSSYYPQKKMSKLKRRPLSYTKEIGDIIIQNIATRPQSSKTILEELRKKDKRFPDDSTFFHWISELPEFYEQYKKAKASQMEVMAEEILTLSDTILELKTTSETFDSTKGSTISEIKVQDNIARAKLMVDTRKWLMAKLMPRKYGDSLELKGNEDQPLTVVLKRFGDDENEKEKNQL